MRDPASDRLLRRSSTCHFRRISFRKIPICSCSLKAMWPNSSPPASSNEPCRAAQPPDRPAGAHLVSRCSAAGPPAQMATDGSRSRSNRKWCVASGVPDRNRTAGGPFTGCGGYAAPVPAAKGLPPAPPCPEAGQHELHPESLAHVIGQPQACCAALKSRTTAPSAALEGSAESATPDWRGTPAP